MSEDWKPGDLAVCVDICGTSLLELGKVYRVEQVRPNFIWPEGVIGWKNGWMFSIRFRKVRPDQHDACEEEFITLLNRTKRRVGA